MLNFLFARIRNFFSRLPCFLLFLLINSSGLFAQNLVPNPSFESFTTCPIFLGNAGPMNPAPWFTPGPGNADYFNACALPVFVGVPSNYHGFQDARTGDAYSGIYFKITGSEYREYLEIQLSQPLVANTCYRVGYYMNLGNIDCPVNQAGALLTPNMVLNPLGMTPQIDHGGQYYTDTLGWTLIYDYYTAVGGEEYLTIGNFHNDVETNFQGGCIDPMPFAYYYIDDVFVVELPDPNLQIDFGGPAMACDSLIIEPGLPGNISYTWSDGSHGATLTVHATGTYSVTATFACFSSSGSIDVVIFDADPVDIGPPAWSMCAGDTFNISLDPALGEYVWSDGFIGPDYSITTSGTYRVSFDDGCGITSDSIVVTATDPPAPFTLGPDTTFLCAGNTIDLSFDPSLGNFLWQDGNTNSNYTISGPGLYSLSIWNACGTATNQMQVLQVNGPAVDLGPSVVACPGDTIILDAGNSIGTYNWQDGSFSSLYEVTTSGMYSVTITASCGMDVDTVDVSFIPSIIPPDLGPDVSLCPGEQLIFNVSAPGANYLWNDLSTAGTLKVTTAGTYFVKVYNTCESFSDTVIVGMSNSPPILNLIPDFSLCNGQSTILDAGVIGVFYLWNDGSMQSQITVSNPGLYILTISNSCGSDVDSVLVSDGGAGPLVDLGPDTSICPGTSVTITPVFSNVNSWIWQDGTNNPFFLANSAGLVTIDVANNCGDAHDTVMIGALPGIPPLSLGPDTAICPGTSVTLSINIPNVNILWSDGSIGNTITVSDNESIGASIMNSCGVSVDSMKVTILPSAPLVDLGQDTALCMGSSVLLTSNADAFTSTLWQDGSTGSTYLVSSSGTYSILETNSCGIAKDSISITVEFCEPDITIYIPNVFSPNDDHINDQFSLVSGSNIEMLSIDGSIYDNWGNQVYSSTSIPFIWDGKFKGQPMMPGVYVYLIKVSFKISGLIYEKVYKGDVTLIK
jgi:gliding motility-associated-like protein